MARIVALACCLAQLACGHGPSTGPQATRTAPPAIPTYPRIHPGTLMDEPGRNRERVVTFVTDDTSEVVQGYYHAELPNSSWQREVGDDSSAFTRFVNRQACPIYSLAVETASRAGQPTEVSVTSTLEECR